MFLDYYETANQAFLSYGEEIPVFEDKSGLEVHISIRKSSYAVT